MIPESTPTPAGPASFQIPLRWRLLLYFGIWVAAGLVVALRAEFYVPEVDDPPEYVSRIYLFLEAPFWVSVGLDAALTRTPCILCWLILVGFVAHALYTFSCTRRASFFALAATLVVAVSLGAFYVLRFFHDDIIYGHA
jgi:CBS-domain-containing membrane protein